MIFHHSMIVSQTIGVYHYTSYLLTVTRHIKVYRKKMGKGQWNPKTKQPSII